MGKRIMWTKQHKNVWKLLRQDGRYTAKKEYILKDLGDEAYLVLEAYDWLVDHMPGSGNRPADAEYPVWLSYSGETVRCRWMRRLLRRSTSSNGEKSWIIPTFLQMRLTPNATGHCLPTTVSVM